LWTDHVRRGAVVRGDGRAGLRGPNAETGLRGPNAAAGQDAAVTLRFRLVLALVLLTTIGLAVFGVVTYTLYARQQYGELEKQLADVIGPLGGRMRSEVFNEAQPPRPGGGGRGPAFGGNPVFASLYGQLRDQPSGRVLGELTPPLTDDRPQLPEKLDEAKLADGETFVVPSASGNGEWLVLAEPVDAGNQFAAVAAVPLDAADAALDQLVFIEITAAVGVLALLAVGSWFILRRGLQPLEHMAVTSRSIAAGDLSQRVEPAEDRTEVGQLGLALNTMLDDIEAAFREREATERRLRQFLADASHELRTPLTSIQGFAELFRLEQTPDHVSLDVILRRIEEESARMKHLVEDMLLLARLDETRPLDPTAVDLAVLAADACSDAVALAPDRPVTLDAPEPVVVLADQDHVRQAIANLVTNAVHHTPPGSPIEVAARVAGGGATVEVHDHGAGLDEDAAAHAFDRFWRADGARTGTGAGLGLAIVAGIAAEHGGEVTAANSPTGGAVFTLHLPLNPPETP
jgi:two-component system OmpR family sensor kinase